MAEKRKKKPPVGRPFQKGKSGNPGGVPKDVAEVKKLAREMCGKALRVLEKIMQDSAAPHSARVAAAGAILDRGMGKPKQEVELSGPEGAPVRLEVLEAMTDEQIEQLERTIAAGAAAGRADADAGGDPG